MQMTIGNFGRPNFGLPTTRLVNAFVEATPGGPTKAARLPRPGLTLQYIVGSGPILRQYQNPGLFNGDLFTISGGELYRNQTLLGSIPYGFQPRMAAANGQLAITSGGALYVYDGTSLTLIQYFDDESSPLPSFSGVAVLYNIFIYPVQGSTEFFFSSVGDPTTINAANFSNAQTSPDPIIEVQVLAEELYFFKSKATEIWDFVGELTAPFALSQGRTYIRGAPAQGSVALLDNALFWVGDNYTIYRSSTTPVRVSTSYIEDKLRESQIDIERVTAYNLAIEGHDFYVINLPSLDQSYAYDCQTEEWAQWGSYSAFQSEPGLLAASTTVGQGKTLYAGSAIDGRVWLWDTSNPTDDGAAIRKVVSAALWTSAGRERLNSIGLACVRGVGSALYPDPSVDMRLSYDGGRTFTSWISQPLGEVGQYLIKAIWRNLGLVSQPGILAEFATAAPVVFATEAVSYNEGRY